MGRVRSGESEIRREITREIIIDAAIRILDAKGFTALSLARIARSLGVQTSTLSWYFASKADLCTYVAAAMFRKVLASIDPALTGCDLLWAFGRAYGASLHAQRDAAKLISVAGVSEEIKENLVPALIARLTGVGITPLYARQMLTAVQALALGWSVFETNPATSDVMRRSNNESGFEKALSLLVYGASLSMASRSVSRLRAEIH